VCYIAFVVLSRMICFIQQWSALLPPHCGGRHDCGYMSYELKRQMYVTSLCVMLSWYWFVSLLVCYLIVSYLKAANTSVYLSPAVIRKGALR
jgi:hypothetical protein